MSTVQSVDVESGNLAGLRRPPRRPDSDPLKSERVEEPLTAVELKANLKSMPAWKMTPGGQGLNRKQMFPEVAVASAYVSYVAELARAAKMPAAVTQRGRQVTVSLRPAAKPAKVCRKGLTQSVFDLAKQLG